MNMISIDGTVKHDLIGWDSIPEIYTKDEVKRRMKEYGTNRSAYLGKGEFVRGITCETITHNLATKVYYYNQYIFTFN